MKTRPDRILLEGIVGSQAYGLATPESDEDILGIFLLPAERFLGVGIPNEKQLTAHDTEPDFTYHELGKFCRLALGGNPTVLEFLWLSGYTKSEHAGQCLVANREKFLSNKVRASFGGYAKQQALRLQERGNFASDLKKRYSKHARHCFRLMRQGAHLLQTGEMRLKVEDRDEIFAVGELPPEKLIALFNEEYEAFHAIPSVLPDEPDYEGIEKLVRNLRWQEMKDHPPSKLPF